MTASALHQDGGDERRRAQNRRLIRKAAWLWPSYYCLRHRTINVGAAKVFCRRREKSHTSPCFGVVATCCDCCEAAGLLLLSLSLSPSVSSYTVSCSPNMVIKPSISMLQQLILLLVSSFIFLCLLPSSASPPAPSSSSLSFQLSYTDAQGSPLKSHADAVLLGLQEDMPMRDYVAAGMAMRSRIEKQITRRKHGRRAPTGAGGTIVGKFTYLEEIVGDFYLTVPVGNPPQRLIFTLDTGSELTWTQCTPCKLCSESGGPSFAFNRSSSYVPVRCASPLCTQSLGFLRGCSNSTGLCSFQLRYGDGSFDAGYISVDYFHFGPHVAKPITFGCAVIDQDAVPTPTSGIMGLNAGPFSFTSQLFSANPGLPKKFAHCLPDRIKNLKSAGTIAFGGYALPSKLKYTPLLPPFGPLGFLYYYVKLEGISVGRSYMKAPTTTERSAIGEGGTIFDSGTALTHLLSSMYEGLVREMRRQTALLGPFARKGTASDVCYQVSENAKELPKVPKVTLHFAGKMELELGPESVLYPADVTDRSIILCLAFASSPATIPLNIIGNYQQQNLWVEYNLQTSSLGIGKADCVVAPKR